jgi:hypothetical protein
VPLWAGHFMDRPPAATPSQIATPIPTASQSGSEVAEYRATPTPTPRAVAAPYVVCLRRFVVALALHAFSCFPRLGAKNLPQSPTPVRGAYVPICAAVGDWSIGRLHVIRFNEDRGFDLKDTIMWIVGIVLAVVAAGLMVWTDIADGPLMVLGMLGILFIAVGARRRRTQQR